MEESILDPSLKTAFNLSGQENDCQYAGFKQVYHKIIMVNIFIFFHQYIQNDDDDDGNTADLSHSHNFS